MEKHGVPAKRTLGWQNIVNTGVEGVQAARRGGWLAIMLPVCLIAALSIKKHNLI